MANLTSFICIFLVAFGHTAQAQSVIMWQVNRLAAEINTMADVANANAKTYVTELQELFDNLNASASKELSRISSSVNDAITTIESEAARLVANANGIDVSKCTDLATSVVTKATEILHDGTSCISEEVDQAEEEVALNVGYVDSQLNTFANYQLFSQHCVARFYESEGTSSDAGQALACVQPLHRSAQLFMLRFEFITDIKLAEDLFSGYESRVANCAKTSTSELESLASTVQEVLEEISTCVAPALGSSL